MSFVASDIGRTLEASGKLADAVPSYRAARDIRLHLLSLDPSNQFWKNDLALSHELVANALRGLGDFTGSLVAYDASIALSRELAASKPDDEERQIGLSGILEQYGEVQLSARRRAAATASFEEALAIATRLAATDPETYAPSIASSRANLARAAAR